MSLQLSGVTLGTALAAANAPAPPTPVPSAPEPTPLPPNPTPAQLTAYQAQSKAYNAYQSYLAQLSSYQQTINQQKEFFITLCSQIITYFVNNTVVTVGSDTGTIS
jgi:hypothetical protein